MYKITDSELIDELKKRFNDNTNTLDSMKVLNERLVEVNRKLLESETLKSNFLSNIRNEINNPLTSILCISMMLFSGEVPENESVSSMAKNLYSEALNLDFQLRNIFVAAEIEAGETSQSISRADIYMLVSSMIELFAFRAKEKSVVVNFDSGEMSGENSGFNTDPEKLQFIMSNLISNAIKYSHEGGRVEIRTWKQDGDLNISVKDYGIGIDESEQNVIFERFRQLDTGASKSHLGHGLGAAITKALVELLNGTIYLSSEKNEGSEFIVSIPEAASDSEVEVYSGESNEFFFNNNDGKEY